MQAAEILALQSATPELKYDMILIYLLTAGGLTPGGSSTVQYTYTHKQYTEQHEANKMIYDTKMYIDNHVKYR